jgi:hypothetical protein
MALAYGRGRSIFRRNRIWRGSRRNKLTALRTFPPPEEGSYLGLCSTWLECGLEEHLEFSAEGKRKWFTLGDAMSATQTIPVFTLNWPRRSRPCIASISAAVPSHDEGGGGGVTRRDWPVLAPLGPLGWVAEFWPKESSGGRQRLVRGLEARKTGGAAPVSDTEEPGPGGSQVWDFP